MSLAVGATVVAAELILLAIGQRRILWAILTISGSRGLSYALVAPGTVLHELSHYLMCRALGVPVARITQVSWFRPRQDSDGRITLGFVPYRSTDVVRNTLVGLAPLLLVPPILGGFLLAVFGSGLLSEPLAAMSEASIPALLLSTYVVLSAGQAAFPSIGDDVGYVGGIAAGTAACLVFSVLPPGSQETALELVALILAPPAVAALLALAAVAAYRFRSGGQAQSSADRH